VDFEADDRLVLGEGGGWEGGGRHMV
jgi:hypothetical protein